MLVRDQLAGERVLVRIARRACACRRVDPHRVEVQRVRVPGVALEWRDAVEPREALVVQRELALPDRRVRLDAVELDERDRREHVREVRLEPRRDLVVERPVATPGEPHVPDRVGDVVARLSPRARPRRRRCSSSRRARSTPRSRCRRPCGRGTGSRPRAPRPRSRAGRARGSDRGRPAARRDERA